MTEDERDAADPWLTLAEIAKELRVNPATVRQWVSRGQLRASRAGVRKWIVRRSDLERMLAQTKPPADIRDNTAEPTQAARRPESFEADQEPESHLTVRPSPMTDAQSAIALYQVAGQSFEAAFAASAYAPPSPGYIDRLRGIADASQHMASTMLNASNTAGVGWSARSGFDADSFPYEVRPGGNRPGSAELWQQFDAALERLVISVSGTDLTAVAHAFRELGDALLEVANDLERDDRWQASEPRVR